jgi:hypothetical protein
MRNITCTGCSTVHKSELDDGPIRVPQCHKCDSAVNPGLHVNDYVVTLAFARADDPETLIASLPARFSGPSLSAGITDGAMAAALGPAIDRFVQVCDLAEYTPAETDPADDTA